MWDWSKKETSLLVIETAVVSCMKDDGSFRLVFEFFLVVVIVLSVLAVLLTAFGFICKLTAGVFCVT